MKVKILSFLLFCCSLISYAQEIDETPDKKYIEEDKNKISVVTGLSYLHNIFGLLYQDKIFRLRPNDAFYTEFFCGIDGWM